MKIMPTGSYDHILLNWFSQINYELMQWTNNYWWPALAGLIFIACLIGMAPLSTHHEQPFHQIIFVFLRKIILWIILIMILIPLITLYLYDTTMKNQLADSTHAWMNWFAILANNNWPIIIKLAALGLALRFVYKRYIQPFLSTMMRGLRNTQGTEKPTDIRQEASRFKEKNFVPSNYYKKDSILIGLNEINKPIYVPTNTWYETNMQVIGPTRYGKGVILGTLMDQIIRRGDCVFYIDPKKDKFAPHIMHQACNEIGRKFYYLTLHDQGIGKWAPFAGGTDRDGLSRMETALGLELTGDPGTDYYKSQEIKELIKILQQTRHLDHIKELMAYTDANRINAELTRWTDIQSLTPKKGTGFSIEKALKEGAVVYIQGSLDDSVIKSATKVFIAELIQEARRLEKNRSTHLTVLIDEVSFLASKVLAQSLATAVGFRVNFVLSYQSQQDLLNLDDKTVNPKYIHQSINVNSQIKAIYGGSDFETAEWAANLSGTITKDVTKMEKKDISNTGGEKWENQRTIGALEENYINTNMILALPPRVFVFVQPRHLASLCFGSFVPVKSMKPLESYLEHKDKMYNAQQPTSKNNKTMNNEAQCISQEEDDNGKAISQAKPMDSKHSDAIEKWSVDVHKIEATNQISSDSILHDFIENNQPSDLSEESEKNTKIMKARRKLQKTRKKQSKKNLENKDQTEPLIATPEKQNSYQAEKTNLFQVKQSVLNLKSDEEMMRAIDCSEENDDQG